MPYLMKYFWGILLLCCLTWQTAKANHEQARAILQATDQQVYQQLRNDPQFIREISKLKWANLNQLNFQQLTPQHQEELVKIVARLLQSSPTIVDPQQLATWEHSKEYRDQASGIAAISLKNMPALEFNGVANSLRNINQGQPCRQVQNKNLSCTQPRIMLASCRVTPQWQGDNQGYGDLVDLPQFLQNNQVCGKDCFQTQINSAGRLMRESFNLEVAHQLPQMRFVVKVVSGNVSINGKRLSPGQELDLSELYNQRQQALAFTVANPRVRGKNNVPFTLKVRGYYKAEIMATHIDWHLEDCPWAALLEQFTRLEATQDFTKVKDGEVVQPQFKARCLEGEVKLPTDKTTCVTINGKQYCRIQNPHNPYLQAPVWCSQIEITWQYTTKVPASCKRTLEQMMQQGQTTCSRTAREPIYLQNDAVADQQDPYSLFYTSLASKAKGNQLRGVIGYSYSYICNQVSKCPEQFNSAPLSSDCPLEIEISEQDKFYLSTETQVCALGRNCPDFIVAHRTKGAVSQEKNCKILLNDNGLITYSCQKPAKYRNTVVTTTNKCARFTCQPGDMGCARLGQQQDMGQVIAAVSLLGGIQEESQCDPRTGVCKVFAGRPYSCRCSAKGMVDCCNLPSQVSLNDYLNLGFKLMQFNEYASKSFGYENPLGSWSSLGEMLNAGFAKAYEFSKQNLTSLYENLVGNSTATGTSLASASSSNLATAEPQQQILQQLSKSLYKWLQDNLGEDIAGKIFTVQGSTGNLQLNPAISQGFNYAMTVYSAYSFGKNALEVAYGCNESEVELANKKKLRSCSYQRSYCSQRILGACVQMTHVSCCYSSPLARILQEQIRAQLKIPQGANCEPLTTDDLALVDWSKINLDEWVAIMLANPEFAQLGEKLAKQQTLLSRISANAEYDQRDASERNQARLDHLSEQLTLDAFVERAIMFLLSD
ncbi:hypothetical protein CKF54_03925 [Psittacicella hinzii]|uniref:Conjugal transfer mating pair stabilization protein TraN n=1 Tax=Psittacicella hinzii TaxID=2028575 RepID=A0A3A1Y6F0_9GAMM|nr:conjugal transfer protein TraN [Psittacicella hinzii]RIY32849.1 hypothetical protein CKF54_03925 [Psittacicella hinzii]